MYMRRIRFYDKKASVEYEDLAPDTWYWSPGAGIRARRKGSGYSYNLYLILVNYIHLLN